MNAQKPRKLIRLILPAILAFAAISSVDSENG